MKVLICDHADCMMPDHALEIETLRAGLGEDVEVEVLEYEDDKRDEFYEHVADADALLTAFVTVDAEAMDRAPKLKVVSLNSTGFDQVDLDEATKRGVGVCPAGIFVIKLKPYLQTASLKAISLLYLFCWRRAIFWLAAQEPLLAVAVFR